MKFTKCAATAESPLETYNDVNETREARDLTSANRIVDTISTDLNARGSVYIARSRDGHWAPGHYQRVTMQYIHVDCDVPMSRGYAVSLGRSYITSFTLSCLTRGRTQAGSRYSMNIFILIKLTFAKG